MLLDTHVLVWVALADPKLGKIAHRRIDQALINGHRIAVSAISFWELGMLVEKGRLVLDVDKTRTLALRSGIEELPIDGAVGIAAARLTSFHGDPADRLIVATARIEKLTLVTADKAILKWKGVVTTNAAN